MRATTNRAAPSFSISYQTWLIPDPHERDGPFNSCREGCRRTPAGPFAGPSAVAQEPQPAAGAGKKRTNIRSFVQAQPRPLRTPGSTKSRAIDRRPAGPARDNSKWFARPRQKINDGFKVGVRQERPVSLLIDSEGRKMRR